MGIEPAARLGSLPRIIAKRELKRQANGSGIASDRPLCWGGGWMGGLMWRAKCLEALAERVALSRLECLNLSSKLEARGAKSRSLGAVNTRAALRQASTQLVEATCRPIGSLQDNVLGSEPGYAGSALHNAARIQGIK
jgi:hypothetical protein